MLACSIMASGCHAAASLDDPLAVDHDPDDLDAVAVRMLSSEVLSATPGGPNLLIAPSSEPATELKFRAYLLERREGWIRLAMDAQHLRLAIWVPAQQIELAAVETLEYMTFDIAPTGSDASWANVERGTRLLDAPGGTAFAVMVKDGPLLLCGGRPEDGHIEVCASTLWGYLRATIECPCSVVRGAGG
jgi:hypothetical protein